MSKTRRLIERVEKIQKENPQVGIYYSLSTAASLCMGKSPADVFVVSFGKRVSMPKNVIHRHLSTSISDFVSFQPFKLDTLLLPVGGGKKIDMFGALGDIQRRKINTTKDADLVIGDKPFLIVRAAAIIGETNYRVSSSLFNACYKYANSLKYVDGGFIWKELKRLLRSEKPSRGIEFLRKIGVLEKILPELQNCYGVKQNVKYHKYTVYQHCLKACDTCKTTDVYIKLAALIHDVGKPETKGKNESGTTFHKHEVVSKKHAIKIVKRLRLPAKRAAFVVRLVAYHMYKYDRDWKDSTIKKFIKRVGLTKDYIGRLDEFPLFVLRHADRTGRDLDPSTQKQDDFEQRLEEALKQM